MVCRLRCLMKWESCWCMMRWVICWTRYCARFRRVGRIWNVREGMEYLRRVIRTRDGLWMRSLARKNCQQVSGCLDQYRYNPHQCHNHAYNCSRRGYLAQQENAQDDASG